MTPSTPNTTTNHAGLGAADVETIMRDEPVAIVGIGCRLPGNIHDVSTLWRSLLEGQDLVSEVPADRWSLPRFYHPDPAAAARMVSRRGGFVEPLKEFDAAFWGISPREAARMDPQQRWLLETAWEAIEDAGIAPSQLRGEPLGVYIGASSHDFGTMQLNDLEQVDVHSNPGGTGSILANRLSYVFDLRGPSLTVDTACSSALVAISMAVQAIAAGRCVAALAGGVNSLLLPNSGIGFSKASMLSPAGRCFAFEERANGYVRSEGAGVLLLKPLSLAIQNDDPIYAVIRGTAVNSDGHTSSLTVPSVSGQAAMLRQAYADAGVSPATAAYVEAHGTGTPVGDPIEASALGEVFGQHRAAEQPLLIGSIKTNLGHLESASGVAGMIKAALVLQHGQIPGCADFESPNPNIPFAQQKLQVVERLSDLPTRSAEPAIVGVNSFGFGGTNAHVVMQAVEHAAGPPVAAAGTRADRPLLLPLSARDPDALRGTARAYRRRLLSLGDDLADFCYSAGARKEQHSERLVVIGKDANQLRQHLTAWLGASDSAATSNSAPSHESGVVASRLTPPAAPPPPAAPASPSLSSPPTASLSSTDEVRDIEMARRPVFVFTGQGSQWTGMGRELMQREPIFRRAIEEIDGLLQPLTGWSLIDAIGDEDPGRIHQTIVAQPAIFAIQVGLVRLWEAWGVAPAGVVGHSVGEVAAAWAAGVYDLPTATRLIYHRSRLQDQTGGHGRMAAIGMGLEEVRSLIAAHPGRVEVTAINAPDLVTIGGQSEAIESIAEQLEQTGKFVRLLNLNYAFHTYQMEPIQACLRTALADLHPAGSHTPMVSTVTGDVVDGLSMDASYWWQNVRQPVMFAAAIERYVQLGARTFLEVGPHPAMRSSLEAILAAGPEDLSATTSVLHSIAREQDPSMSLAVNLARLHVDRLVEPANTRSESPLSSSESESDEAAVVDRATAPLGNAAKHLLWNDCPQSFGSHVAGKASDEQLRQLFHNEAPQITDENASPRCPVGLNWRAINQSSGRFVRQPAYAWNRKPFWIQAHDPSSRLHDPVHPFLQTRLATAAPIWQTTLDPLVLSYLKDHQIFDGMLFPAAGYVEIGLAVGSAIEPESRCTVEDVELLSAMFLPTDALTRLQVVYDEATRQVDIYSSPDRQHWELHGRCRLVLDPTLSEPSLADIDQLCAAATTHLNHDALYARLREQGYGFGADFSLIGQFWSCDDHSIAEIEVPDRFRTITPPGDGTRFHPAVLDACFQAALRAPEDAGEQRFYLPDSIGCVRLWGEVNQSRIFAIARDWRFDGDLIRCHIDVTDADGRRLADIRDFCVKATGQSKSGSAQRAPSTSAAQHANEELLVRPEWRAKRLAGTRVAGSCDFPTTPALISKLDDEPSSSLQTYLQQIFPALRKIAVESIQNAWVELGWGSRFGWPVGQSFTTDELLDTHAFADEFHAFVRRQLPCLVEAGWLKLVANDRWEVATAFHRLDIEQRLAELVAAHPEAAPDVEMYRATMPVMSAILAGEINPLERMFPGGSSALMKRFYNDSLDLAAYNQKVTALVEQLIAALPPRRSLRILEVGGGTGATTAAAIEAIRRTASQSGQRVPVEYLFTDISPAFLSDARAQFGDREEVRFDVFNVEQDPRQQNVELGGFDLVIAANVLHATRDLRQTLEHLKCCLAEDGMLLVHEITGHDAAIDNLFGVLPGWWRFADHDLRVSSPLLDRSQWIELLETSGWQDVGYIANSADDADAGSMLSLLIARRENTVLNELPASSSDDQAGSVSLDESAAASVTILVAGEEESMQEMAHRLRLSGQSVAVVCWGDRSEQTDAATFTIVDGSRDEFAEILASVCADAPTQVTIVFDGSGSCQDIHLQERETSPTSPATPHEMRTNEMLVTQRLGVHVGLALVQAIEQTDLTARTRLLFITRDAQRVTPGDRVGGFASASLAGFAGVIKNELPLRGLTTIDLPAAEPRHDADLLGDLLSEIQADSNERDVAYRDGTRYVSRLRRISTRDLVPRRRSVSDDTVAYRLQTRAPGVLDNLSWNETRRVELSAHEIEVRVVAGGINFRDVMKALGIYPGDTVDRLWFGDDLAGIVSAVGAAVDDLQVGDPVVGIAPWAFRSHAVMDRRLVMRCPDAMSLTAAATIPTVFLTVQFALDHVARMRAGESILIHAAAGGVGQAAIQVAQHMGLTVFATAGSEHKRSLLRDLGVEHVMNSRTFEFVDQIKHTTQGRGVDVVLNSLAGEFIPKSLSVLAPFGRFLEIGKADVYGNSKLGLASLKNNLSYHVIDLSQWIVERPDGVADWLAELKSHFDAGHYQPLTHQVFPAANVVDAFRIMAKGEHTGKNVIRFAGIGKPDKLPACQGEDQRPEADPAASRENTPLSIGPCTEDGQRFRSDGTFLVTGGAGGFGFETARWLTRQGARSLVLLSRSGPDESTLVQIEALRAAGIDVVDARGDVTKRDDLARVIDEIESSGRPLSGVVHAAMVIDDDFASELDVDRFDRVLHPKLLGAWHLHELTKSLSLEHFILFSSISALMGASRQSHYNAGNEFLNALARHRQAAGLPALSINWSAIEGAGFVHRNAATAEYLRNTGFPMLGLHDAWQALDELVLHQTDVIGVAAIDWSNIARLSHFQVDAPYYEDIRREQRGNRGAGKLQQRLSKASADQRPAIMRQFLVDQVAGVFGIDAGEVDVDVSLNRLGMDSLMAVELVNRIESEFSSKVPMSRLLSGPSINTLTDWFLASFDAADSSSSDPSSSDPQAQHAVVDFQLEADWDDSIEIASSKPMSPLDSAESGEAARVFLTGASGFLGAHLLSDLLLHTTSSVTCLIRAEDESQARDRLQANLQRYGLLPEDSLDRVEIVVGDLEKPLFGLSGEAFDRLSQQVDVIYHNGANVNLMQPYERLRAANVDGTRETLRLACQSHVKPIHFVSTYTVHASPDNRGRVIDEDQALPDCGELMYGYSQTKWVAERMLEQARDRGVPVTIYRPGHITGDSRSGIGNENDLLHTIVLKCLELGTAPLGGVELDATPVDFVSRAIIELSQQSGAGGQVYHLTNPVPFRTSVLHDWLAGTEITLQLIAPQQWREQLIRHSESSEVPDQSSQMLAEMLTFIAPSGDESSAGLLPRLECSQTTLRLARAGITCPPADDRLLQTGAAHLMRLGLLDGIDAGAHAQPKRKSNATTASSSAH